MVVHIHNPSYLGGRNQEGPGLRPARAKSYKLIVVVHTTISAVKGRGER
jgi:hypothetical protein